MPLNYNFDYEIKFAYYNLPTLKFLLGVLSSSPKKNGTKRKSSLCEKKPAQFSLRFLSFVWVSTKKALEQRCVCLHFVLLLLFLLCCYFSLSHAPKNFSFLFKTWVCTHHMCVCNFKWVNDNLWDMCIIHILHCVSAFVLLHNLVLTEITICCM